MNEINTYGEKIQNMIQLIDQLYNDAEWLRDYATSEEKKHWNAHREIFYDAGKPLMKLQSTLSKVRSDSCLCVNTKSETIYKECASCNNNQVKLTLFTCTHCAETFTRGYEYCSSCE